MDPRVYDHAIKLPTQISINGNLINHYCNGVCLTEWETYELDANPFLGEMAMLSSQGKKFHRQNPAQRLTWKTWIIIQYGYILELFGIITEFI